MSEAPLQADFFQALVARIQITIQAIKLVLRAPSLGIRLVRLGKGSGNRLPSPVKVEQGSAFCQMSEAAAGLLSFFMFLVTAKNQRPPATLLRTGTDFLHGKHSRFHRLTLTIQMAC
jgi:hypothetical protein